MATKIDDQLQRFLNRGRNRRRKPLAETDFKPAKQANVLSYRPYKGGVSPQTAAARRDVGTLAGREDVANAAARYDVAQRKRKRKTY